MHKNIFGFLVVFSLISSLDASEKFVTGGVNVSQFYDAISKPLPGYSLGFGWEWKKGRSSALLFIPSFLYRGVKLENKKVVDYNGAAVFTNDIWCRIGYLDLLLNYRHYIKNRNYYLSVGSSFCLALYDGSDNVMLDETITRYPSNTDYGINIDPGLLYILSSSSFDMSFSAGIKKKSIDVSALARISAGDVRTISGGIKGINANFLTLTIQAAWYF